MKKAEALRLYREGDRTRAVFESVGLSDLSVGEVRVAVEYSGINYKDALAVSGKAKILRRSPLIGGIDLAGQVTESRSSHFSVGDRVLVNGSGLSESIDGGYTTCAKVPETKLVRIPDRLSAKKAMLIGTAGFTSALAIMRMERNGQNPDMGEIIVSGATGGVGSFAVDLLSNIGYAVVGLSRKQNAHSYLSALGATRGISELEAVSADLGKATWAGGIDNLGGETLARIIKMTKFQGNVVSVGLAESPGLSITTLPFIIRGVCLLGVTSANCLMDTKRAVWQEINDRLMPSNVCFEQVLEREVRLSELQHSDCFEQILAGKVRGRILVNCQK